jgi:hypothetical protein
MAEQTIKAQTDRLAWVRLPTAQAVSCQAIASSTADEAETAWLGRLREISLSGLSLLLNRRFDPGTLLIIELSDKAQGRVRAVRVRVVHSISETQTRWIMVCKFVSPLNEEELQTLVGE